MRLALSCWPVALLFLATVTLSNGQSAGAGAAGDAELAVAWGAALAVECALRPEQQAVWTRDGLPPPPDMRAQELAPTRPGGPLRARLLAAAARAHHAGRYSCAPDSPAVRVRVTGTPAAEVATTAAATEREREGGLVYFEYRANFTLRCGDLAEDPSTPIVWSKNGTALDELPELRGHVVVESDAGVERATLKLVGKSVDTDWGNYTCSAGSRSRTWQMHGRPIAKLLADTNVVEGQKLKLVCKLIGLPLVPVAWSYSNSSDNSSHALPVADVLGERVSTHDSEQGVPNGELLLDPAQRGDAGWFFCTPEGGVVSATRLRVKDMYAALWPFLGICAEVFVLCTIILVYEKRRTKPELDDSDTDNHDQKKS